MDWHIERLLNRISFFLATVATLSLLHLFFRSSLSCAPSPLHRRTQSQPQALTLTLSPFPRSSCDAASRDVVTPEKRFQKLRSTRAFSRRVQSFSSLFLSLRSLGLLSNASHVLCVSAGAGHEVSALQESGVADVTGVEVVDFPPLVKRADPHNLPFFDGVFDLGFSTGFAAALFPSRFVAEIERTVRRGGATVLAVDGWSTKVGVEGVYKLFQRSSLLEVRNFTLDGSPMTLVVMRNHHNSSENY
ncbi:hypothetical protein AXF42_Ash019779 [Apostasia shenzhenica]|uniref:Methyltransferase type 11 domain-containing protein n=1 Tax=Apostasia shenzhenica TaxID=1088818 RepID=A0A2I0AA34_9ASPA|nr:hypothetical protein AXF42_Ash019779 [Apostasia shenzhenica]